MTELALPVWAGYRAGPNDTPFHGDAEVTFHGKHPTAGQLAALDTARARAAQIQGLLLDAIVAAYPMLRHVHDRPKSITKEALKDHVQLYEVVVTKQELGGEAYLAYIFACDWDPSGFVVLAYRDRVVSVGGLEVLEYPLVDAQRSAPPPKAATAGSERREAPAAAAAGVHANPKTLRVAGSREFTIVLPVWTGFSAGMSSEASTGEVLLSIGDDSVGPGTVGPEQEAAYRWTIDRAGEMQRVVLDAIVAEWSRLVRAWRRDALPDQVDRGALERLVSLTSVHIQWAHRDGVAYVGYGLACAWDAEHGLGVLTHRDRVVAVGGADTAFLAWVAHGDPAKPEPKKTAKKPKKASKKG